MYCVWMSLSGLLVQSYSNVKLLQLEKCSIRWAYVASINHSNQIHGRKQGIILFWNPVKTGEGKYFLFHMVDLILVSIYWIPLRNVLYYI